MFVLAAVLLVGVVGVGLRDRRGRKWGRLVEGVWVCCGIWGLGFDFFAFEHFDFCFFPFFFLVLFLFLLTSFVFALLFPFHIFVFSTSNMS